MRFFPGVIVCLVFFGLQSPLHADEPSFYPTWKLLDSQQKQQFIAGYMMAWKDAANVTDLAIKFVKTNPDKALDGLQSVRRVYDLSSMRPETLSQQIDAFYESPANRQFTLTQAISFAKNAPSAEEERGSPPP